MGATAFPSDSPAPSYLEPLLGIVFDLDGTLIVSDQDFGRMRHEVIRIAELYGMGPGRLSISEPTARLIDTALDALKSQGLPDTLLFRFQADIHRTIDGIEMQALSRTRARIGAAVLLKALEERGFRVGLLTRSGESFCRAALIKTELAPYFPYLRTRSASGPAKPHPDALLLLLKEMGVPVGRALFVGDHRMDAECATGAGVRFFGILPEGPGNDPMTIDRFKAAGAKVVAKDLTELGRFLGVSSAPHTPPVRTGAASSH